MLTIQQKAQCVLWYHELKSPTAVQRKFRSEFGEDPPHTNNMFQQDGAPPHWGLIVRDFLNETFPNRWIGRNGPTP